MQLLILSLIEVNVNKGGRIKCPYSEKQLRDHWVPDYLTIKASLGMVRVHTKSERIREVNEVSPYILIRLGKQVRIDVRKQDIMLG